MLMSGLSPDLMKETWNLLTGTLMYKKCHFRAPPFPLQLPSLTTPESCPQFGERAYPMKATSNQKEGQTDLPPQRHLLAAYANLPLVMDYCPS